jgi:nucleoside-diphosphate-sugar epimerase
VPTKILVTGASGFLGRAFALHATARGLALRAAVRHLDQVSDQHVETVAMPKIDAETDWSEALQGITAVVHCAARAHVTRETSPDPLAEFRRVNVAGTIALARQAARGGVRRFIFISSIGVNGAETFSNAFTADDIAAPDTDYALSKYEAETELWRLSKHTGLEIVIIRPPLIYGPRAKGNLQSMIRWINYGIPLPFGAIHNKRSLIAIDNLLDLMFLCLDHPLAANQIFLASDGTDISTTELLRGIAAAFGRRVVLFPIAPGVLRMISGAAGRQDIAQKLISSLQIDDSKTRERLGWSPPVKLYEGLRRIATG